MSERRVPVIYQDKRKLVKVNFASFENVVSSISHRLNVTGMQLFGKRSNNEDYFDIEDDDDLEGLEDAESLVLLVKDLSLGDGDPSRQQRGEGDQATGRTSSCQDFLGEKDPVSMGYRGSPSASMADEAGGSPYSPSDVAPGMPYQSYPTSSGDGMPYAVPVYEKPPEYAESIDADRSLRAQSAQEPAPTSQANMSEDKITAVYGGKTKKIVVERSNFEAIHQRIANRFELQGDFQLQVKDESGNKIDIDKDEDAADNEELMHTVWVVPVDATANKVVKPLVTEDMALVMVNKVQHSITELPDKNSQIVLKAIETLRCDICIPSISAKLNEVEECLRIAYYASIDNKELHGRAQKMQFDIQKLCGACNTTMLKIKLKAGDILNELRCGFGYLLEGFEDFGLERLGAVGPIAVEIQTDAASLQTLLTSQENAVMENLAHVQYRDEGSITAEEETMFEELQTIRQRADERRGEVYKSESQISRLAERELSAVQAGRQHLKSDSGIGFGFKKLLTFGFYEGNKSRAEQEERFAREMREEQARERDRLDKLKEEEERAKIEFHQLVAMIDAPPNKMSAAAVQGAKDGIKTLTSLLQSLAEFWENTGAEFKNINNTAFIDQLKKLSDPETRKSYWTSKNFKFEAMQYVARFVAIQTMCEDFHKTMTRVLDTIHQCIRDNPTADEAKAKLPKLVKQFSDRRKARTPPEYQYTEENY